VPLHHVEAEDVSVEAERTVDVGDLQVDVTDVDARIEAHAADDSGSRDQDSSTVVVKSRRTETRGGRAPARRIEA
jgi:hypothetical protein